MWISLFHHISAVYNSPPSQEGSSGVVHMPDSRISVWDFPDNCTDPLCMVVICPGTHRDFKSHLHSVSRQKDRLSLGKPEHMVAL